MKTFCSSCELPAEVVHGNYKFSESGLNNVILQGIELLRCKDCGNEDPIIPKMNELMRVLTMAVIARPYRLGGQEVRFLRKYLGMTGDKFARLLHVDKTTLSKWENNEDLVGPQSDLAIRLYTLQLGEGLPKVARQILSEMEKIKYKEDTARRGKLTKKRPAPQRPDIQIDTQTLEYQYA